VIHPASPRTSSYRCMLGILPLELVKGATAHLCSDGSSGHDVSGNSMNAQFAVIFESVACAIRTSPSSAMPSAGRDVLVRFKNASR
jgi:hypothetical protein